MPGFDRHGPLGAGPMTGGQRGFCRNATQRNQSFNGFGMGRRTGLGRRFRDNRRLRGDFNRATPETSGILPDDQTNSDELGSLKDQVNFIQNVVDEISKKMTELTNSFK